MLLFTAKQNDKPLISYDNELTEKDLQCKNGKDVKTNWEYSIEGTNIKPRNRVNIGYLNGSYSFE